MVKANIIVALYIQSPDEGVSPFDFGVLQFYFPRKLFDFVKNHDFFWRSTKQPQLITAQTVT